MRKALLAIALLYLLFLSIYLSSKYALVDDNQCGRCVHVCSAVCLEKSPCGFEKYVFTYFSAAFEGCKNVIGSYLYK